MDLILDAMTLSELEAHYESFLPVYHRRLTVREEEGFQSYLALVTYRLKLSQMLKGRGLRSMGKRKLASKKEKKPKTQQVTVEVAAPIDLVEAVREVSRTMLYETASALDEQIASSLPTEEQQRIWKTYKERKAGARDEPKRVIIELSIDEAVKLRQVLKTADGFGHIPYACKNTADMVTKTIKYQLKTLSENV